jgi:hypothetical protein
MRVLTIAMAVTLAILSVSAAAADTLDEQIKCSEQGHRVMKLEKASGDEFIAVHAFHYSPKLNHCFVMFSRSVDNPHQSQRTIIKDVIEGTTILEYYDGPAGSYAADWKGEIKRTRWLQFSPVGNEPDPITIDGQRSGWYSADPSGVTKAMVLQQAARIQRYYMQDQGDPGILDKLSDWFRKQVTQ